MAPFYSFLEYRSTGGESASWSSTTMIILIDELWRITQQVDLMINDLRSLQTHSLMMMFPVNNAVHTQAFSRNLRSYGGYLVNTSK